jgi:hypothetical protein
MAVFSDMRCLLDTIRWRTISRRASTTVAKRPRRRHFLLQMSPKQQCAVYVTGSSTSAIVRMKLRWLQSMTGDNLNNGNLIINRYHIQCTFILPTTGGDGEKIYSRHKERSECKRMNMNALFLSWRWVKTIQRQVQRNALSYPLFLLLIGIYRN